MLASRPPMAFPFPAITPGLTFASLFLLPFNHSSSCTKRFPTLSFSLAQFAQLGKNTSSTGKHHAHSCRGRANPARASACAALWRRIRIQCLGLGRRLCQTGQRAFVSLLVCVLACGPPLPPAPSPCAPREREKERDTTERATKRGSRRKPCSLLLALPSSRNPNR